MKNKILFLISHPIQYYTPLFREMSADQDIDLQVVYCSDETVSGYQDKEFGVQVRWDTPILEGHKYIFLKNNAPKPSIYNGFFGLINWEIFGLLKKNKDAVLIIHGWNRMTYILAMLYCWMKGIKFWIHSENPLSQELLKSSNNRRIKKVILSFLFRKSQKLCYIGEESRLFYEYYGAKKPQLVFTPYSVDNSYFATQYETLKYKKEELKKNKMLPADKVIVLFSGKYIHKKRPMDLLKAAFLCNDMDIFFVFMGDGELRPEMEAFIQQHNMNNVLLTGFKNQSEIPEYFTCADIFVLPSGIGETWGLVVNEAMNFELPLIVSDVVGSSKDLVEPDVNGYIYTCGNIAGLVDNIRILYNAPEKRHGFGVKSKQKIAGYSNTVRKNNIKAARINP